MERRRSRRAWRSLLLLAVSGIAGLATAGPALAADEPTPPEVSAIVPLPEPIAPPISVPPLPPELMEPPVVVTQVDAENIDVSVRVLSPGEEGTVTQEAASAVVSPAAEADITAPPASTQLPGTTTASQSGATNTNVSIRVLSPGDNGDVDQDNGGGGDEVVVVGAAPGAPHPDATTTATTSGTPVDSSQYQEGNSRYQSESQLPSDPWNWRWVLTLDCAGNAASSSTETGLQDSLVWSWEWAWEWGCSDGSPTESNTASPGSSPPPAVAGKPPNEDTSTAAAEPTAVEPWVWTWTFTFCGETRTISTRAGTGTPLTWTWDWSWTWSCGGATTAAVAPPLPNGLPPPLAIAPPSSSDAEADAVRSLQAATGTPALELPTVWPVLPADLGGNATTGLALPALPQLPVEITVEVAIPPVVLPVPTAPPLVPPEIPFPSGGRVAEPAKTSPALPPPDPADLHTSRSIGARPTYAQIRPRGPEARPARETRAQEKRSPRAHDRQLPFERRQPRQAAGSASAGGVMPSALLLGVAALTGFVLLAAPGLGRRIRLARLLRPRGLDRSPIDHPG